MLQTHNWRLVSETKPPTETKLSIEKRPREWLGAERGIYNCSIATIPNPSLFPGVWYSFCNCVHQGIMCTIQFSSGHRYFSVV